MYTEEDREREYIDRKIDRAMEEDGLAQCFECGETKRVEKLRYSGNALVCKECKPHLFLDTFGFIGDDTE